MTAARLAAASKRASGYGNTAVASISSRAKGSTSRRDLDHRHGRKMPAHAPRDRRPRACGSSARYSSMPRTYQVSRTMCCGVAPASAEHGGDVLERELHLRDEALGRSDHRCPGRSCRRRIPSRRGPSMPLAKPFGRGQPGGCSIVLGARVVAQLSDRAFSRHLFSLRSELVRGGVSRDAAQLEALQLAGLRAAAASCTYSMARGYLYGRDRRP